MSQNPKNVTAIKSDLRDRIRTLVPDDDIDLDSPLYDQDE